MRLIDADELIKDVTNRCSNDFLRKQFIEEFINWQPTINDNTLKELKSAIFLIETLEIILSGYSRAATNMCAYEAYKKIKDWQSNGIKEDF